MNSSEIVAAESDGRDRSPPTYREQTAKVGTGLNFAQDRHKRAARAVLCALVLDDERPGVWSETAVVLSVRLTEHERFGLALAALLALDPVGRELVFDAAQAGVA